MPASTLDEMFSPLYRLEEGQRRRQALIDEISGGFPEYSGLLDEIERLVDRLLPPPPSSA